MRGRWGAYPGRHRHGRQAPLHSAEAAGKQVTGSNIAYYAIQLGKSGRRSTRSSRTDVHARGTQLNGSSRLTSMDEPAGFEECGGEIFTFNDVLSHAEEDPAMAAARHLDWETLCAGLTDRERAMVVCVAEGGTFRDVAQAFGMSDSGIQVSKRSLGVKILELMGGDILVEVRRSPRWRDNLVANYEKAACRAVRQAA